MKELMGYLVLDGRGVPIEKKGGCAQGFSPVGRWHERMEEHGTDGVICGTEHAFNLAILWEV